MPGLHSNLHRFNINVHLAVYILASVAIALLLYEESELVSQAGVQADILGPALLQQAIMTILLLGLLVPTYAWSRKRWPYPLASILFAGYSGTRLAAAFDTTLELVPTLEARGVPISDYQGTFYLLALVAAFSYLLMILLLRRSYGRLSSSQGIRQNKTTA